MLSNAKILSFVYIAFGVFGKQYGNSRLVVSFDIFLQLGRF